MEKTPNLFLNALIRHQDVAAWNSAERLSPANVHSQKELLYHETAKFLFTLSSVHEFVDVT